MALVDVNSELERKMAELREIDTDLSMLTGKSTMSLSDRINRKRPVPTVVARTSSFDSDNRRVQEVSDRRRIVISTGNDNEPGGRLSKRIRYSDSRDNSRDYRDHDQVDDDFERPPRRVLQSSVVMPPIETKSREAVLSEMKKKEKKEDVTRNRNMFSRLLVGTLKQFQKEEKTVKPVETKQTEKLNKVERKLEMSQKEDLEKVKQEKQELFAKRREKEREIQSLKRKKAIAQYAEEKVTHYKRLQQYIQTQTKPPLFYLPAKHTLRTLELLKNSAKKIDVLIEHRQEQMEKELKKDEEGSEDEFEVSTVKSRVVNVAETKEEPKEEEVEPSAIIDEDMGEPPIEITMEAADEGNVVQVRSSPVANRTVEAKPETNGEKKENAEHSDKGYSSDEDGVSARRKKRESSANRSSKSKSRTRSRSRGRRSRSSSSSSSGSSRSSKSGSGKSDKED